MNTMSYIHHCKKNGKLFYNIRKQIKGKQYNLCYTQDYTKLLPIRDYLVKNGWDLHLIDKIKTVWYNTSNPTKNIYKTVINSKTNQVIYIIKHWENGRNKYYGKANTLEEAIQLRNQCIQEGWSKKHLTNRKYSPKKYIHRKSNGNYILQKRIHGKTEYFGTTLTFKDAVKLRKQLIKQNWDVEPNYNLNINKYIIKQKNSYAIRKWDSKDKVYVYYNVCYTLDDARKERDFWESINWDMDLLDLY